ncbi:PREDICTED: GPALPP motifs-containing protein 1 isoform X2 [Calidris pugnax]|uniref:GPALPP motifs-containing protein 1 isoform X1 n=1 Tax=Calidris pugnax TaxID=198806 RepID=UPI00071D675D|nr:PREDICTED: GPALPP motifs-containing protein 1 isoform X1 [Calidris pugnax]XP_014821648.1 PREDICTED: GPALPP motifs-containing protein 1 isoform X2 [Calidris pugnax]
MTRELIGPALPPGFSRHPEADPDEDFSQVAGPALPPGYKSSCSSETPDSDDDSESLPPTRDTNRDSEEETEGDPAPKKPKRIQEDDDDDDGFFGPGLPPGFKKQDDSPERPIIGPALPPGFRKPSQDTGNSRCAIGPSVSSEFQTQVTDSSEEDDDFIGPMPAKGPVESDVTKEFERRAQRMKEKLTSADSDEPKQVTRESWMTELPPELKSFGFGPRTFKRRADDKSGDRSIWTDTPADRERKAKEREEAKKSTSKDNEEIVLSGRDKRLVEQVTSYNESKRSESLMDIHQKKLKSKASEEKNKPQERRPFDRDQDLKVNRFDEAQKKALIRKSRDLNSKFEHSKGNMFL